MWLEEVSGQNEVIGIDYVFLDCAPLVIFSNDNEGNQQYCTVLKQPHMGTNTPKTHYMSKGYNAPQRLQISRLNAAYQYISRVMHAYAGH